MSKIMICKRLSTDEDRNDEICYSVPDELEEKVREGEFIYIVSKKTERQEVGIAQVIKLVNPKFTDANIINLSENEKIHLVSREYFKVPEIDNIEEYRGYSIQKLRRFIKGLIDKLELEMFCCRTNSLNDKRREYLLKIFFNREIDEFHLETREYRARWFRNFNNFELDLVHMLNLYNLKELIDGVVDENKLITETEKISIKEDLLKDLDTLTKSINLKGINRFKLDDVIGIDFSEDGKNIVLGRLTSFELNVNFFSFWNIIKNLLTVSFIPVLIALLDSDKKIVVYSFLGVVYLIALVLSDEKQTEYIITFMRQIGWSKKKQQSYGLLLRFGLVAVLVFVIFSIQIVYIPEIVSNLKTFAQYFIGDCVLAIISLFFIVVFIELLLSVVTSIMSTVFYLKRAEKLTAILSFFLRTIFWIIGVLCVYRIFEINLTDYEKVSEWRVGIFAVIVTIAFIAIINSISEFRGKIKKVK
ncbi:hypothetical protein [Desulfosporosinus fructosivorans]